MQFRSIRWLLPLLFLGAVEPCLAAEEGEIEGIPLVQDSGQMRLGGNRVELWGIETLAGDQQCWHKERAWHCGEQATSTLKHFAEGQRIKCQIKEDLGEGRVKAQCFRQKKDKQSDLGSYLIAQGWAMEDEESSDGAYAQEQEEARFKRRGIWTSRFQTADDWREGLPNYVQYEMTPEPMRKMAPRDEEAEQKALRLERSDR
ncbi:MAG: hypothetical protein HGA90_03975 [Alphaproteobacteria bacterium]|nr:hypothetical protein [Alphaproteobacteria bacterium]